MLEGTAPAGARLRLTKTFKTETFQGDEHRSFDDNLETAYDVGASGTFRWHVNPSTPDRGQGDGEARERPGAPRRPSTGGPTGTADDPADDGAAAPGGDAETNDPAEYNDHPLTIPTDGDNATAKVRIQWRHRQRRWDMKLYRDANGDGRSQDGEEVVGVSQQGTTDFEELILPNPFGKYVLRVANFAASEPTR